MNPQVLNCKNCGGALHIVPGQCVIRCPFCGNPYCLDQELPPAVVLAVQVDEEQARERILKGLREPRIEPGFLRRTFFERATLYYVPFYEVRGVKAGWSLGEGETDTYSHVSFEYLEPANDLETLSLNVLDRSLVEAAILNACQVAFRPVEMRRRGVVLPAQPFRKNNVSTDHDVRHVVETHLRLVYFPMWEVAYSYRGMVFRSYCSAVDGSLITVKGLRNHRRKLGLALLGLFSLALLLGRMLKLVFVILSGVSVGPVTLLAAVGILALGGLIWGVLFPYLWRLYAFREEIEVSGAFMVTRPVNYREGRLLRFSREFVHRITGGEKSRGEP